MDTLNLKVLSLNCWGIPIFALTKLKNERLEAIGKELSKGKYDIVMLQEIWSQKDYKNLCDTLGTVMPYSHYWYSGTVGSGLCVFSKYTILETFQHKFTLNGYAHKLLHGDWFGGKCVGLAKIAAGDFKLNLYVTHIHSEYINTDYEAHRVSQAYEMSQFIRYTSDPCDVVIVGGDFNFRPDTLGYKMIKCNANLDDAWLKQKENKGHRSTSDTETNSFTKDATYSQCIDYIMYRGNSGNLIDCEYCCTTMEKMPGTTNNYSDHEGVEATLVLRRLVTVMAPPRDSGEIEKHFTDATPVLETGIKCVKANQIFYLILFLLCVTMLVFTNDMVLPYGLEFFLKVLRVGLTLIAGFSVWSGIVLCNRELSGLMAVKIDINNLLKANPAM